MTSVVATKPTNLKPGEHWGNLQKYSGKGGKNKFAVILENKVAVSHNAYRYTFKLPDPELTLGAGPGQHINIIARIPIHTSPKGVLVTRIYCPISPVEQTGSFEVLFKVYRKNTHPKYPSGGLMSQHLEAMNIGDSIDIQGPLVYIHYPHPGAIQAMAFSPFRVNHIGMIIGGSGITPIIPILRAIAQDKYDQTKVSLLYANNSEADILLKDELDQIAATCPQIQITYIVSKPVTTEWQGLTGYVTKDMIKKLMPAPAKGVFMWVGGPPQMDETVTKDLAQMGYPKNRTMAGITSYIMRLIFSSMCCSTK